MKYAKKRILIVAKDEESRSELVVTLENAGNYITTEVDNFEEALNEILLTEYELIIAEAELPDLSGIDLLAVTNAIRPKSKVILFDDDLSAKSAVAAFRLGAIDYFYKPLNMTFVLLQIERHLQMQSAKAEIQKKLASIKLPLESRDRSKRLNPSSRAATLVLNRRQFEFIDSELHRLLNAVKASFIGLIDADGNMMGAVGTLDNFDLQMLAEALTIDYGGQKALGRLLGNNSFTSTYFKGEQYEVYIIEFGIEKTVSLAVVCEHHVKQGMIWLYSKRTASIIDEVLKDSMKRQTRTYTKLS